MKSLIKAFFRALTSPGISESGEFLSTRRKAHLLYAEMYTRVASEGESSRNLTNVTDSHQLSKAPARSVREPSLVSAQAEFNS